MTINDHYFGELRRPVGLDEVVAPLRDLLAKAKMSGGVHFTEQVRRVIAKHGCLVASDGTTAPPFAQLLDNLDTSRVGLVRLTSRSDVNLNTRTLQCSMVFVEGLFHVRPHWCAWKPLRASEVIETLLVPLIQHGLIERTLLPPEHSEKPISRDPAEMVSAIFQLAGEPYSQTTHGPLDQYSDRIREALGVLDARR